MDRRVTLETVDETRALGRRLAEVVEPGDLIVLAGPLGAGKTVLVQGIGAGLGVDGPVVSPTFVISRVHGGGRLPLVHVDAYRLGSVAEVDDLDLDTDLDDSLVVIEWGEGKAEQLSVERLTITIERNFTDEVRTATLNAVGESWNRRLADW